MASKLCKKKLLHYHPKLNIKLVPILTTGDLINKIRNNITNEKGLFIKELEKSLLKYQSDIAVHSMKDFSSSFLDSLGLAAICKRDDPRDAIVSNYYNNIISLPNNAKVGTSSLRRKCQLLSIRPDLKIFPCKGNIHSRLKKLNQGVFDALILATAALKRLKINEQMYTPIDPSYLLPAMGQGSIAIQCRLYDNKIIDIVRNINNKKTALCINSEKIVVSMLGTGCRVPIGSYAKIENKNTIWIRALVGSIDGSNIIRSEGKSCVSNAEKLSKKQVKNLINLGAKNILKKFK
ncbi:hemC [Wigglesworthia glossinidia endosymbiont of Glossina brevipalpis]|uniref:Hydroxymethylbilane synthase n=1 Tax=Wigglesworthia glossinidia brevipalpis TaxID=36870 RepID=Q8D2W2_WIGBR|nr:hemC [Wigglesworthia glossinidia endosymbiont of Glossina brevipalpis]